MIGKTNALAGGANLKYATGTIMSQWTETKYGNYYVEEIRVIGLDFQPVAVFCTRSNMNVNSTSPAGSAVLFDETLHNVAFLDGGDSSWLQNELDLKKSYVNDNTIENGFVIPISLGIDRHTGYDYAWYALGI